ncbi:PLP-dependent aminotransferase family protein [Ruegeria sp. 2205SS24-7]|uniref:aminotransferase-like domain-containing protein n=1 Tax=Ruegeria discodermiae TaxID=3064389 RepID=UPI002740C909|nr:PLP-dependent aminotransferase family protein [Ruegeria sp. 2205SS24-7]MDP5220564.1 PLP-dependent aminotransferase family protein [Ruegeria sp. 2205SS24-7]
MTKTISCIEWSEALKSWTPNLRDDGKPLYVQIAEAIRHDVETGVLDAGDRLPPQRSVAKLVGLDFTTVSRGYSEAAKRGYIDTFVGRGSFIRKPEETSEKADPRRALEEDPNMNMPPEPDDPALVARMEQGLAQVAANLVPLLRYQSIIGSRQDRETAARWMNINGIDVTADQLAITPGAHASLLSILTLLAKPGDTVICERVTYPGIRAIGAQLGIRLIGVRSDDSGILPDDLDAAIQEHAPSALYLNPTLQNPLTLTIPMERRQQIASVLDKYGLPLIEDDACRFVSSDAPPPISQQIPELGWYIAGLSKCLGAGLRLALAVVPSGLSKTHFTRVLQASNVMASPITTALMARWVEDGTAAAVQKFVRKEANRRQNLAAKIMQDQDFMASREAFNIWLALPEGSSRADVMSHMANRQIGIMPSNAFTVKGMPDEAVRVCLGGPISYSQLTEDLEALNYAIIHQNWVP